WFKAYVTIGPLNFLSALSKILYVDLIHPTDKIVQSIRLPLILGGTMGDFKLADSLSAGNYRIRAYTNWMRNFDSDAFFDHTFRIGTYRSTTADSLSAFLGATQDGYESVVFSGLRGGPRADPVFGSLETAQHIVSAKQEDNSIQFFPESGRLISGNLTKVAFKALRPDGLGIAVSGYVEDGAGMRITEFESA